MARWGDDPLAPLHDETVGAFRVSIHQTIQGRLVARIARVADGHVGFEFDSAGLLTLEQMVELATRRGRALNEVQTHERPAADADGAS